MHHHLRGRIVGAATVLIAGALAATAVALPSDSGGTQLQIVTRTGDAASTSDLQYRDLGNSWVGITVPEGQSRLVHASFTAASRCRGATPAGLVPACRVRIIATNPSTGDEFELDPSGGLAFFDSDAPGTSDDGYESHAIERSRRLPPGHYRMRVQYSVAHPAISFALDDWHFTARMNE
jgi:hypothetical protein